MIPTSVRVYDSKLLNVRSDVPVRFCVRIFKFCVVHILMDRCVCVHTEYFVYQSLYRQYLDDIQIETGQTIYEVILSRRLGRQKLD